MHTGQSNPHSVIIENISRKFILDLHKSKYVFPALSVSNSFPTIDYDAHVRAKIDHTFNHVFHSMTVQELNTFHTVSELERNQLLVTSLQTPQFAGFLLKENGVVFCTLNEPKLGFMITHIFSHRYIKLIVIWILYLFTSMIPLCTLILLLDKRMTRLLL